jgi:hypothetical protein
MASFEAMALPARLNSLAVQKPKLTARYSKAIENSLRTKAGAAATRNELSDIGQDSFNLSVDALSIEWMSQLGTGQLFFVREIEAQRGH